MTQYSAVIDTPLTRLGLVFSPNGLCRVDLHCSNKLLSQSGDDSIRRACAGIDAYFNNHEYDFEITLAPQGTLFQKSVWRVLQKIKSGEVRTYGNIADELGTSPRAVGNACRRNPIPIIIPCHRVVSRSGIGGYAGKRDGTLLDIKQRLLAHEGIEYL